MELQIRIGLWHAPLDEAVALAFCMAEVAAQLQSAANFLSKHSRDATPSLWQLAAAASCPIHRNTSARPLALLPCGCRAETVHSTLCPVFCYSLILQLQWAQESLRLIELVVRSCINRHPRVLSRIPNAGKQAHSVSSTGPRLSSILAALSRMRAGLMVRATL